MNIYMRERLEFLARAEEALSEAKGDPLSEIYAIEIRNKIRLMLALDRWPEDMSRPDLRDNFKAAWGELGWVADATYWTDLPEFQPAPGNDYPNVVYFIKRQSGLDPDTELRFDQAALGIAASA